MEYRPPSDSTIAWQPCTVHLPQGNPLRRCQLSGDCLEAVCSVLLGIIGCPVHYGLFESSVKVGHIEDRRAGRSFCFLECEAIRSSSERYLNVVCRETLSSQYHLGHTQSSQDSASKGEGYCKWIHTPINWALGFPLVACRGRSTLRYLIPQGFLALLRGQ